MFITCSKSVRICEGGEVCAIPRGFVGNVPGWVAKHWYFNALVKDGTISASGKEPEKPKEPEKSEKAGK